MAREDIRLEVIGDIDAYVKAVGKIPGVTEAEAEKAGKAFVKSQKRAQIRAALEAEKAAQAGAKSWTAAGLEAAKGFAAGFAVVGAVVGTVGALVDTLAETRLEMDAVSRSTGIGLDTLSGLATAFELAGKDGKDAADGLEDFGEKMFDASRGTGAALETFELLGFTQEELANRLDDTDGVLREVIAGMQGAESAAIKNTIQQQLMGDAGLRLGEVLGDIPLEEFIAQSEHLGKNVTPENVESSRQWKATLAALKGELIGTGVALADFFNVSQVLEDAALGFVFLKNVAISTTKEAFDNVGKQLAGLGALITGDFERAGELLVDAFDIRDSIAKTTEEVRKDTQAFVDLRETAKLVGDETVRATTKLSELSEEQEKATKAAADRLRKEEALAKRRLAAAEAIRKVQLDVAADTLSAEDEVLAKRDEQLRQLGELQAELGALMRAGVDVSEEIGESIEASVATQERAERELASLRLQRGADERRRVEELAELREQLDREQADRELRDHQAKVDRTLQALDLISQFQDAIFGGLTELSRRQQDATREAVSEQKEANRDLRGERKDLKAQLLEDITEEERATIEAQIATLDAEIDVGKKRAKRRREDALKAFRASKAIALADVAFRTSAAVMAAFAIFGPPPSPVGIASAAAAGTNAAIQTGLILSEKPPQFHDGFDGSFPVFTQGPDERNAVLRRGEPVLNSRAADNLGRENIQRLNQTGGGGGMGAGPMGLFFDGRQIDDLVTRTLNRGGQLGAQIRAAAGSGPKGQVNIFATSR